MLITFTQDDARYMTPTDAKLLGNVFGFHSVSVQAAHLKYLFRSKSSVFLSAFGGHVPTIIEVCTKKEMIGIDARWIVTLMQTVKAVWNGAVVQLPTKARCSNLMDATIGCISDSDGSISAWVSRALPLPTFIRPALIYLFPEAFCDGATRPVPTTKLEGMTLEPATSGIGLLGNGRRLTTTTHAQSTRIWAVNIVLFALIVIENVLKRLVFAPSAFANCRFGNLSLFATTTVAVTIRDFVRGIMGSHQKFTFWCHAAGRFQSSLRLFAFGFTPSFYHMRGA